MKARAELALQPEANILEHAQVGEYRRNLEGAHHAGAGHLGRGHLRDVLTLVENLPGSHWQELGQQIEHRRLARAIGADKGVYGTAPDLDIDPIDCNETLELAGQVMRLQNEFRAHASGPKGKYPAVRGLAYQLGQVSIRGLRLSAPQLQQQPLGSCGAESFNGRLGFAVLAPAFHSGVGRERSLRRLGCTPYPRASPRNPGAHMGADRRLQINRLGLPRPPDVQAASGAEFTHQINDLRAGT